MIYCNKSVRNKHHASLELVYVTLALTWIGGEGVDTNAVSGSLLKVKTDLKKKKQAETIQWDSEAETPENEQKDFEWLWMLIISGSFRLRFFFNLIEPLNSFKINCKSIFFKFMQITHLDTFD